MSAASTIPLRDALDVERDVRLVADLSRAVNRIFASGATPSGLETADAAGGQAVSWELVLAAERLRDDVDALFEANRLGPQVEGDAA